VVRQVVAGDSGGAAQLVERRVSNRKVAEPWFDSRCGGGWRVLKGALNPNFLNLTINREKF